VPVEVSKVEAASLAQRYLGGLHSKKEPPMLHKLFMTLWTERCVKTSIPRSMHNSVVKYLDSTSLGGHHSGMESILHLYSFNTLGLLCVGGSYSQGEV
jgi:hypothetical protein